METNNKSALDPFSQKIRIETTNDEVCIAIYREVNFEGCSKNEYINLNCIPYTHKVSVLLTEILILSPHVLKIKFIRNNKG